MAILKFIGVLIEVLFIFNLLIIVHELGHFLAAKWRGLYIEGFGIWFGKPIWKKKIGDVTYSLGCIPAGGFVKLPQLAPMEALEGETEISKDQLKPISALDKIIVAFAGPLFSFGLACVFAVIVWKVGRPMGEAEGTPVIGYVVPGMPAEKAGLQPGDRITGIDGQPVTRFGGQGDDSIQWRIVRSEGETVEIQYERDGKAQPPVMVKPRIPTTRAWERKGTRQIGIAPMTTPVVVDPKGVTVAAENGLRERDAIVAINGQPIYTFLGLGNYISTHLGEPITLTVERDGRTQPLPFKPRGPIVESIIEGGPAARAGLKAGDRIVGFNGQPPLISTAIIELVEANAGREIVLTVERGTETIPIRLTPEVPEDEQRAKVGFVFKPDFAFDDHGISKIIHPTPFEQIRISAKAILNTIDAVSSRKSDVRVQHMGGPVMMMRIYYNLFQQPDCWMLVLWFSVILNVNLALLNMLPLPVLDGGHIVLALIEGVRRKPVNVRILEWVQTACALLIIGFMLFISFFDVGELFGGPKDKMKFKARAPAAENAK